MPELVDVSLAFPDLSVEPGHSVEAEIVLRNGGSGADSAALDVDFAHPEWVAIPVPAVALDPGQSRTVRVVFKVPRDSAASTGSYPFAIRAHSVETGGTTSAQGTLQVKPFHSFSVMLSPIRRTTSPLERVARYDLRIENGSNAAETFDLSATDPERLSLCGLPTERVEVGPGESAEITLTAQPRRWPLIAPPSLHGFEVKVSPLSGSLPPESVHGQLEFKALCTPFVAWFIFLALAYLGWLGWQRNQGPVIHQLTVQPPNVIAGQSATLHWDIAHANKLTLVNENINHEYPLDPTFTNTLVHPDQTTRYTLIAVNTNGLKDERSILVTVTPPVQTPPPRILSFRASPDVVNYGQPTLLTWKVADNPQSILLAPLGKQIDPALPNLELNVGQTTTFELIARNAGGIDRKQITVTVIPPPNPELPKILMFSASPRLLRAGDTTTVSWNVTGASNVTISGVGVVEAQGSRTLQISHATPFQLVATGPGGQQAQKEVGVEVVQPPRIIRFDVSPATVQAGGHAQLRWEVHGADSVSIDPLGSVESQGAHDINPDDTTTYTLKAVDAVGQTAQATATLTVAPGAASSPQGGNP